ncbi:CLUMA_CG001523, isoform A [Clunio marinus]|uniref:CLUMA_CG001523, isoform A n=1 Tax=Clunio marinus TaxID=568069 RepID=A0A1J1HI94_9DIPT|nr:CLUMA_CG001523, isoform A [Clunio marinus]
MYGTSKRSLFYSLKLRSWNVPNFDSWEFIMLSHTHLVVVLSRIQQNDPKVKSQIPFEIHERAKEEFVKRLDFKNA